MNDATRFSAPLVLGYTPMDDVHAEFTDVVGRALECPDAEFDARLEAVVAHLRSHFATEDRWMDETGFPPGDCHRDEHAAVLKSAAEVLALEPDQRLEVGRDFVRELSNWFPAHADYLDSALAAWMFKRTYGGKPVVLHRRTGAGAGD
jgi:hemerythrin